MAYENTLPDSIASLILGELTNRDSVRVILRIDAYSPIKFSVDSDGEIFAGFGYATPPKKPQAEVSVSVLNPGDPVALKGM